MSGIRIVGMLAALMCGGLPPATASTASLESATAASAAPLRQGTLSIASLGLRRVPVLAAGSRGDAIRVPRPSAVGWWRESVPFADTRGASLLIGHVSDRHDRPGALYRLSRIKNGAIIRWRQGPTTRVFRVTRVQFTPRTKPLPRRVWTWRGTRTLHLVSCARRIDRPGGFHYTHNVTVTARQLRVVGRVSDPPSRVVS